MLMSRFDKALVDTYPRTSATVDWIDPIVTEDGERTEIFVDEEQGLRLEITPNRGKGRGGYRYETYDLPPEGDPYLISWGKSDTPKTVADLLLRELGEWRPN